MARTLEQARGGESKLTANTWLSLCTNYNNSAHRCLQALLLFMLTFLVNAGAQASRVASLAAEHRGVASRWRRLLGSNPRFLAGRARRLARRVAPRGHRPARRGGRRVACSQNSRTTKKRGGACPRNGVPPLGLPPAANAFARVLKEGSGCISFAAGKQRGRHSGRGGGRSAEGDAASARRAGALR
jgi:hypothetical protein